MIIDTTQSKLSYNTTIDVESNIENNDVALEFSDKNKGKQFFIMLKGLYSNPLGSLIRELISNCFDAYAEIGLLENQPVFLNFDIVLDKLNNCLKVGVMKLTKRGYEIDF